MRTVYSSYRLFLQIKKHPQHTPGSISAQRRLVRVPEKCIFSVS